MTTACDRRQTPRPGAQRREHARTPGKFKDACDTAFRVIRAYEREVRRELDALGSTQTEVLLQGERASL